MRRRLLLIALALAGSQAGHLIAYAARFGAAAGQLQSRGAHAYYPVAARLVLGLGAIGLLMALGVVALAHVAAAGSGRRVVTGPSFISLFAILFTIQLGLFVSQEIAEATLAGAPADSVSGLVLWGMLGQLPAAAGVAAILRFLWTRVEQAVSALRALALAATWIAMPAPLSTLPLQTGNVGIPADHAHGSRHTRRGPPSFFIS